MNIAPVTAPAWTNSHDTEDYSFEWAEWTGDKSGDVECTLHFKESDIEVDPVNPDDFTMHVTALEVVGAEITYRGVTEYHDRESIDATIDASIMDAIDASNLERAVMSWITKAQRPSVVCGASYPPF